MVPNAPIMNLVLPLLVIRNINVKMTISNYDNVSIKNGNLLSDTLKWLELIFQRLSRFTPKRQANRRTKGSNMIPQVHSVIQ